MAKQRSYLIQRLIKDSDEYPRIQLLNIYNNYVNGISNHKMLVRPRTIRGVYTTDR